MGPDPISIAGAVFRGSLAHNAARTALSVLAIALGVALGYAVQLINQAAINELSFGVQTLSGEADLDVRGPRGGFDEAIYPQLAAMPEVAVASPVVEVDAKLAGRTDTLRIIGIDVFRAGYLQPGLVPSSSDRMDVLRPDNIFPTPAAARWLHIDAGDTLKLQVALSEVTLRVAGLLSTGEQQRFAVMDIAGAQAAFDRLGRVSRIDLRLRPGVDVNVFRDRVREQLPPGLVIDRPAATLAAATGLSRSYRVNLNVLALVALFTGGLLVFSTQAFSVVQRRGQFALLRVLGVTRRKLVGLIVAESALVGVSGSVLGLIGGFVLARLAVQWVGADLGSGYFRGIAPTLVIEPFTLIVFFVLGVVVAMLGSLVPALEAARAAPALALHAGDEQRAFERLRPIWPGLIAAGLGALATALPPIAGLPLFGYLAIALLLIGTLMLMPRFAVLVLALLPTPRHAGAQLALAQLRGAPGQVMVSLAAMVASVSLMVSMVIMVSSFRYSLDDWLDRILPADVYFRTGAGSDTAYLTAEMQSRIAALPGIRRVEFLREQQLLLDSSRPRIVLQARPVDASSIASRLPLEGKAVAVAPGAPPPVWVNEAMVDVYGFTPGKVVSLPIGGKSSDFTVAGVFRDYARQQGAIVIDRERYVALTGDATVTNGALWLAPGVTAATVGDAITREIPGGEKVEIAVPTEIREASLRIFDRTFAVTYALEFAALVIGLFGLSSSFGALVLTRRREFGVLRHIGMTRRQIGSMLAIEGVTVSGIGLVVGLGLGGLISIVLIRVVNRQSFHWDMDLSVPWLPLCGFVLLVLVLATITAVASGRQAMGDDVVRAVKDDW
jgi:putative ABC transport system permease protein